MCLSLKVTVYIEGFVPFLRTLLEALIVLVCVLSSHYPLLVPVTEEFTLYDGILSKARYENGHKLCDQ